MGNVFNTIEATHPNLCFFSSFVKRGYGAQAVLYLSRRKRFKPPLPYITVSKKTGVWKPQKTRRCFDSIGVCGGVFSVPVRAVYYMVW